MVAVATGCEDAIYLQFSGKLSRLDSDNGFQISKQYLSVQGKRKFRCQCRFTRF